MSRIHSGVSEAAKTRVQVKPKGKARKPNPFTPAKPVKRVRKPAPPKPETLKIVLEPGITEVLKALSESRGVDVQTLVRVALRNLIQRATYYGLQTRLSFGKYRGETLETVIRCDPSYVNWALKTFDGMQISEGALDLLTELQTAARAEVA